VLLFLVLFFRWDLTLTLPIPASNFDLPIQLLRRWRLVGLQLEANPGGLQMCTPPLAGTGKFFSFSDKRLTWLNVLHLFNLFQMWCWTCYLLPISGGQ
jgi:hypothetical protein